MNAQNVNNAPKIKKESKNKIRVEFERTPLKQRLKEKFLSMFFLRKTIWYIFRFILLVGISYVVLFPFFSKLAGSVMGPNDFVDVTVRLIPKEFTLGTYKAIITELNYFTALWNTLKLSFTTALIQTFICCVIAYGLAKFKFKGNALIMGAVILTMIIPHATLKLAMVREFRYFDILGILQFLSGGASVGIESVDNFLASIKILNFPEGITLLDTSWPMILLSLGGLGFKNGLYIFLLRQFFRGVPDELEESAYIDGSGVFRTFIQIIIPLSIPMLITVFLFSFSWTWTDNFYSSTSMFYPSTASNQNLLTQFVAIPTSLQTSYAGQSLYYAAIRNTCGLLIIAPLVILYIFCQNFLVQGIERSGITG